MDKHQLAYYDFIYIALLRKISSFHDDLFVYDYECYQCGTKNTISGRLSEIEFDELHVPALPVRVTSDSGVELQFLPFTVGAFIELQKIQSKDQADIVASQVSNMSLAEAKPILTAATGDFLRAISYADEVMNFGITSIKRNCVECKAVNTLSMEDPEIFISPFRGSDGLVGSRISFGV
jgi:hypothetical protein